MQGVGLEGHLTKRAPPRVVLAFEIALQHQPVVAQHDETVQVPDALVGNGLVQARFQIGRETSFGGRDGLPLVGSSA